MTDRDVTDSESSTAPRRIVTIASSKGGCGASMTATNLSVFLAQIGKTVVLVDANSPVSGLHAWLGMSRPEVTIADIAHGRLASPADALTATEITGLSLIAGSADLLGSLDFSLEYRDRIRNGLRGLEADFVVVDLPTGLHPLTLGLFGDSDVSIAVTIASPDAVEATYRLIQASYLTKILEHPEVEELDRFVLNEIGVRPGKPPTAREVVARLEQHGSPLAEEAARLAATFHPQIVVNKISIKADEGLGASMVAATTRWIGIVPRLLGTVAWDDNVWLSLRRGTPLLIDFPQSRACRGLERVVRRILGQDYKELFAPARVPPPMEKQNLYELLEIYPSASEEEVRRAFKQLRDYFGPDGLAVRGACTEGEREEYQRRAAKAQEVLIDKSRRREYDRSQFPNGLPGESKRFEDGREIITGRVVSPHDSLPKVELRDDQMVDGVFLGEIRKERGIELVDISNRAKISVSYLRAIEEERFEDLPAPVYIRGFVTEFARYLKIDPARAVADFMATYEAHLLKKRR